MFDYINRMADEAERAMPPAELVRATLDEFKPKTEIELLRELASTYGEWREGKARLRDVDDVVDQINELATEAAKVAAGEGKL